MKTPLLATKLSIPITRADLVVRPRLLKQLDACLHSKLTVISAPAGFGKTTLAAAWAQTSGIPLGWLSLDTSDNDPVLFFSYLLSALRATGSIDPGAFPEVPSPQLPSFRTLVTDWINQITQFAKPLILVLDDYHLIENQSIHNELVFLIENLPGNLHLILITRSDPPVPMARLRGLGQLVEIREAHLRFSETEALEFFRKMTGLALDDRDVYALQKRTEGWIVGLQLAGLAVQGRQDIESFVQSFTGEHHFIIDYLTEEVLVRQPEETQNFLIRTCILDRMCASLCDAVTGGTNSEQMLQLLNQANLFVIALDDERHWYRYHRLFSDLLQRRLQRSHPDMLPDLHRRASLWYEQQDFLAPAIEHALAAQDDERAATLIEKTVETTLMRSEIATFLSWVEKLPDEQVRNRPRLCFYHAWALLMSGKSLDLVEMRLQDLALHEEGLERPGPMAGRMAALNAYRFIFQTDTQRAAEMCIQALEQLPETDLFLRGIATWILSLTRLADGGLQEGKQALEDVTRMGQQMGNPLIAVASLCHQAKLQTRQGRLHQARHTLEQALQLATDSEGRRLPIASEALLGLGELELEWNHLETAAAYLTECIELSRQWSELAAFDAYYPLARTRIAQGDVERAHEAIETARRIASASESTQLDDLIFELQQADFFITRGDLAGGMRWAESRGLIGGAASDTQPEFKKIQAYVEAHLRKYEQLLLSRLLILQCRTSEALELLNDLYIQARKLDRTDLTIQIQIQRALALHGEGKNAEATDALAEALSLAEPGGYVRTFLDAGATLITLLHQAISRDLSATYAVKLREAFDQVEHPAEDAGKPLRAAQPLIEPLSERELDVLRLLATGMSNPEIAEELIIAVSTVRSHCKSIYGKLDVHKRWDAVHRAQELNLI